MSTILAPSFANLLMGDFEEKFVETYHLQLFLWKRFIDDIFLIWTYGSEELESFVNHPNTRLNTIKFTCETYHLQLFLWKRFIDDIFLIWTYGSEELETFVNHLNNNPNFEEKFIETYHLNTIKFTCKSSRKSIDFLDITIKKSPDNSLETMLYCKPNDTHNYLLYSSEHPRHLLKGTPFSQLLRVRRICSKTTEFIKNAIMLCTHFIRRNVGETRPHFSKVHKKGVY